MIACRNYETKPGKYTAEDFEYSRCNTSFTKGRSKQPFGKDEAKYVTGGKAPMPKTVVEIIKVSGKVIEGRFFIKMVEEGGTKKITADGTFKAEYQQK